LPDLRRILGLRDLGVSLAEIRSHVVDGADLHAVLKRRQKVLEDARREVDRRLSSLGISLAAPASARADVVVRMLAPELVATLDIDEVGGDEGGAFYELERRIRDAGVRAHRPPGTLIAHDVVEVYVPVRRSAPGLSVLRLPAVRAATILHHGSYETTAETRATLDSWIAAAGLTALEPERIVYLQFGAEDDLRVPASYVVERDADLLTELQVPVA
jgi:effector-binding domain-containing protein